MIYLCGVKRKGKQVAPYAHNENVKSIVLTDLGTRRPTGDTVYRYGTTRVKWEVVKNC